MKMERSRAPLFVQHSLILALSLGVFGIACDSSDPEPKVEPAAKILSFDADPAHLTAPGPATLRWSTSNAVSLDLLQDGAPLDLGDAPIAAGELVVELEESATFELIATGKAGSPATRAVSVVVDGSDPAIATFEAPEALSLDAEGIATARLSWTGVAGAAEVVIEVESEDGRGEIPVDLSRTPDAQIDVDITATTTFTLVASNAVGATRLSATTQVVPFPAIAAFSADRSWVGFDDPVELSWTTVGAASVELWVDGVHEETVPAGETSGSFTLHPMLDVSAELRAINELGLTNTESLAITVAIPEIASFEGSPSGRWLGQPLTLSWSTMGGRELRLTTDEGETLICESSDFDVVDASSCQWEIDGLGQHAFTLAVTNGSGSASDIWQVDVGTGPAIETFTVDLGRLSLGETATIQWVSLADPDGELPTLTLRDNRGTEYTADEATGELLFTPTETGTYVFTLLAETSSPHSIPVEATVEVQVFGLPTVSLSADPLHFDDQQHANVVFQWTAENAASLVFYQLVTDGEPLELHSATGAALEAGSFAAVPDNEHSYSLVATNGAGATASAEVSLTLAPPAILSFTADPLAVVAGEPIVFEWTTSMANEVELSLFDKPYYREETYEPFLDVTEMGGVHLPITTDCPLSTNITLDRHSCALFNFPAGFSFPFDGDDHAAIRVYSNGHVSFDLNPANFSNVNHGFPTASESYRQVHIAPFWDGLLWDLDRYPSGNIHTLFRENPSGNSLVVQWKDIGIWANTRHPEQASLNFELILWENGDFEYRYGSMEGGDAGFALANGSGATIGFQTPSQSFVDVISLDATLSQRGSLVGRTFAYRRSFPLDRDGTFTWRPYATEDLNKVELRAKRAGATDDVRILDLTVIQRPSIEITLRPKTPVETGTDFRVGWRTSAADGLQIVNRRGEVVCEAENTLAIAEDFCEIQEAREGVHTYLVRALGALGSATELSFEVQSYAPFEILSFTSDKISVEPGEGITLSWETLNAFEVSLTENGTELLPDGAPSGLGTLTRPPLAGNTTYVLTIRNSLGVEISESVDVEMWRVRVDVTANPTEVRPGDPVTVNISATALDGGPTPKIFGSLPMVEILGPGSAYTDIANTEGAEFLALGTGTSTITNVDFPNGFRFPYFGVERSMVRVFVDGYVSFTANAGVQASNRIFPDTSTTADAGVHLAPFWDDLIPRNNGHIWTKLVDNDTYVIQWTAMSMNSGSTASANHNLNFQLVLFRDGTFEYRYGTMAGLPTGTSTACWVSNPRNCQHEADGASATIGYQNPDWGVGTTHHFGGTTNGASTIAYPGGLSNRTFRYQFWDGTGQIALTPLKSQGFVFCAMSGADPACKYFEVEAEFGIDEFTTSTTTMEFNAGATLSWRSRGARSVVIRENGTIIHTVTDLATVDQGSFVVNPTQHATYQLSLTGDGDSASATLSIDVARVKISATQSASSLFPGDPVTLSWTLTQTDPAVQPVVIAPMVEVKDKPFSELDLTTPRDGVVVTTLLSTTDLAIANHSFSDGFIFNYFGENYTAVRIASEGYLSFESGTYTASALNQAIPNTNTTYRRAHLAPFWDDLRAWSNGKVLAARIDADRYVFQWSETSVKIGSSDTDPGNLNFMIVLHSNGDFEYRYGFVSPPIGTSASCFPETCWNEFNGSAATIGYQALDGTAGSLLHFEATTPGANNRPVAGGLSYRSWKFTRHSGSGSVQVLPADSTSYQICAVDPVTRNQFCAAPLEVEVPWGINSLNASSQAIPRGGSVTLNWNVAGLDQLWLKTSDDISLAFFEGDAILPTGSFTHTPSENTVYVLEGKSLGRVIRKEILVEIRGGTLVAQASAGRFFPGDPVTLTWDLTVHEPGHAAVTTPMVEIPAGPGQEGEYDDVRGKTGAIPASVSSQNGHSHFILPFPFPYFGHAFNEVRAYVDGYATFDVQGAPANGNGINTPLPSGSQEKWIQLAPFWDDLVLRGTEQTAIRSEIWTYSPNDDTFIIQWTDFNRNSGSSNTNLWSLNFQVVLHRSGRFEYRYGTMKGPPEPASACQPADCWNEANGGGVTIGYQTVDQKAGHTFHFGDGPSGERVPVTGGLGNRTLRYDPLVKGSYTFPLHASMDYPVCSSVGDYIECQTVTFPLVADLGDLVISELMLNTTGGSSTQWFEVRNISNKLIDLDGFVISSDTAAHLITGPLLVGPGEFLTFAQGPLPSLTPDYSYGSDFGLNRKIDTLEISAGTASIASVSWDYTWLLPLDKTLELDPSLHRQGVVSNDRFQQWCPGSAAGTPRALGEGCFNPYYNVDTASPLPFIDISRIGRKLSGLEGPTPVVQVPSQGFSMPFFGVQQDTFWVSSNGWLSMSKAAARGGAVPPGLNNLPRTNVTSGDGPLVAAFWDQIICNSEVWECAVTYHHGTYGGEDVLIVQWTGFRFGSSLTVWQPGGLTFQVQLWRNGDIVVAFADPDLSSQHPGSQYGDRYRGGGSWIAVESGDQQSYLSGHHRQVTDLSHRTFRFIPR